MSDWTFFSNHGHVLVCLARNHKARLRDVAQDVGITERAVQKIVRDMRDAEIIEVSKQGRCNHYRINRRKSLRHGLESHCTVGKLLNLVGGRMPAPSAPKEDSSVSVTAQSKSDSSPAVEAKPKSKPKPKPQAVAEPVKQSKSARPVDEPQASSPAVEQNTSVDQVDAPPDKPRSARKSSKSRPVDTRQQGSLF